MAICQSVIRQTVQCQLGYTAMSRRQKIVWSRVVYISLLPILYVQCSVIAVSKGFVFDVCKLPPDLAIIKMIDRQSS
jgi:hypothetical protein